MGKTGKHAWENVREGGVSGYRGDAPHRKGGKGGHTWAGRVDADARAPGASGDWEQGKHGARSPSGAKGNGAREGVGKGKGKGKGKGGGKDAGGKKTKSGHAMTGPSVAPHRDELDAEGNLVTSSIVAERVVRMVNGDAVYEGGVRLADNGASWLRHGRGRLTYTDGNYYDGWWLDDKKYGRGEMLYGGDLFTGQFYNGKRWGPGVTTSITGDKTIKGRYLAHKLSGEAETDAPLQYIKANYDHGKLYGRGVVVQYTDTSKTTELSRYEGEFADNARAGRGVLTELKYSPVLKQYLKQTYEGAWANNLKEGQGTETLEGQWTYTGEFKAGQRWGVGTVIDDKPDGTRQREGQWVEGALNGEGVLTVKAGTLTKRYVGAFKNNVSCGHGVYTETDGDVLLLRYEGAFDAGRHHGHGVLDNYARRFTYTGEFVNGEYHGQGRRVRRGDADSSNNDDDDTAGDEVYEGAWARGEMCGHGRLTTSNGAMYEGPFWAGRKQTSDEHPTGTWRDIGRGDTYVGAFKNGRRHGAGVLTTTDEVGTAVVSGTWVAGDMTGEGEMRRTKDDGTVAIYRGYIQAGREEGYGKLWVLRRDVDAEEELKYEGRWRDGRYHGHGTMHYDGGNMYEGRWKFGQKEGWGKETTGTFCYEGTFASGKKHGRGTLTSADGDVTEGEFMNGLATGEMRVTLSQGQVFTAQYEGGRELLGTRKPVGAAIDSVAGEAASCIDLEDVLDTSEWSDSESDDGADAQGGAMKCATDGGLVNRPIKVMRFPDGRVRVDYESGGSYEGQVRIGAKTLPNGYVKQGHYFKEGWGFEIRPSGLRYKGDWVGNMKEGRGETTMGDYTHVGGYRGGRKHGYGREENVATGYQYEGEYDMGQKVDNEARMVLPGGTVYEGAVLNGKRHGHGRATFPDGRVYSGQWHDDRRHGDDARNTLVNKAKGSTYRGGFANDRFSGHGVKEDATFLYEGEFKEGVEDGRGMRTDKVKGTVYTGDFVDGRFEGHGELRSDAEVYTGGFHDGKKHGEATVRVLTPGKEHTYTGRYADGHRCGTGRVVFDDGKAMEGTWDRSMTTGKTTFPGGTWYDGTYKDGRKHGFGTHVTATGVYEGEFAEDKRHGKGTTYAPPDFTAPEESRWANGERNGAGRHTDHLGRVYIGDFKDGKLDGAGELRTKGYIYKGPFKAGVRNGPFRMIKEDDGTYHELLFVDDKRHGRAQWHASANAIMHLEYVNNEPAGAAYWTDAAGSVLMTGCYKNGTWYTDDDTGTGWVVEGASV